MSAVVLYKPQLSPFHAWLRQVRANARRDALYALADDLYGLAMGGVGEPARPGLLIAWACALNAAKEETHR